jgi:hypothetical protein
MLPLDYDTLAVADKFGNISVLRLPAEVSAQVRFAGSVCRGVVFASRLLHTTMHKKTRARSHTATNRTPPPS